VRVSRSMEGRSSERAWISTRCKGNTMKKTAEQKNKSLVLEASTRDRYPGSTVRISPDKSASCQEIKH
jgi:hypothetical protein